MFTTSIQHRPVFPQRRAVVRTDPNPIDETIPAYAWVLQAVAPLNTDTMNWGSTLVRQDYHDCLVAILSSLYRQKQGRDNVRLYHHRCASRSSWLNCKREAGGSRMDTDEPTIKEEPMGDDDAVTDEPTIKEEPMDDDDALISPKQLRVKTSVDLSNVETYPNPFDSVKYGGLYMPASVVIISGLPGIGKTRFLCLLFYLRVAANLPTLYMSQKDNAIVYKAGGFGRLQPPNLDWISLRENMPKNTWCLVDSNKSLDRVPPVVIQSGLFIIQAASPRKERMDYVKDLEGTSQVCLMRDWTLEELIVGSTFRLTSTFPFEQKMKDFFERYGGSARHAFKDLDNPTFEADIDKAARALEANKILQEIESTSPSLAISDEFGHMLLSAFPLGDEDRRMCQIRSPSVAMRQKLFKRIGSSEQEGRGRVFRTCKGVNTPGCKAWTSDILNEDYHGYLLSGKTWSLFAMKKSPGQPDTRAGKPVATHGWKSETTECERFLETSIRMSIVTARSQLQQQPPTASCRVFEKEEEPVDLQPNVYYHPRRKKFATFDSFYVDKPGHALVFQASAGLTHDVGANGVEWLAARGVTQITYIYVWPTGIEGWPEIQVPVDLEKVFDSFYHLRLLLYEVTAPTLGVVM
ncbi:hypothetical protein GGX14DRAFT_642108 [Mycena pura]|uniref:Uncharacterized protein n=1 Tax=Mycena pura TaxID=153505 RepID=A0AAD6YQ57_9AGAR|nr:hypothetical protein GGX14DRAFT_642108 [Mycena pura]